MKRLIKITFPEKIKIATFVYEIKPTNFNTLPDDKKMLALSKFFQTLSSIQKPIRIIILKEPLELEIGNEIRYLQVPRTYVVSNEPLELILEQIGLEYSMISSVPNWKIKSENLNSVILENNNFAKCYTLYKIPSTLPAAWTHSLLSRADMVSIWIKPIENHKAVSQMIRYAGLVGTGATKSYNTKHSFQKSQEVLEALSRQETKLFNCSVVVTIVTRDLISLKIADKNFKTTMRANLASFDATSAMQKQMLNEGIGKVLYFELGSTAIFYPFVSADMIEVPNGVPLGINLNTMAPVIYDYTQRENYNILLLAASGAGKSVTAKTCLTRLSGKYPDAMIFIIDPNGEYEAVTEHLKLNSIRVTQESKLGLEPFKMFTPSDAADILGDITKAPDTVRKEFRAKAEKCSSVKELCEKTSDEAKKFLVDLVEGPISNVLQGDSRFEDRMVISLRGTSGEERVSMLLLLTLGKIWKQINSSPTRIPKILVIDEGWMLFQMASAGRFLNMIARMGRKFNVIFMFITQRPEDVIENDFGRAIADNAGTKIFLQNTEQASEKIKNAMALSDLEADMLKSFGKGECLFLTKDYRLRVQITPTKEELKIFSTTPTMS
ncbi:VirB4 family type IV secretion system protein [Candidatus Nitrosotenuis sp. DW1]|uniref:VirB4 family type IV secretion system protein n=1 Tax=Candidatus Nitrosotenuis sp. DW1 TaxID=2259672 RepID=UPI0015C99FA8|nr:ATP-binding protein [Candidatus Nitrosotenuis sp. DW1]